MVCPTVFYSKIYLLLKAEECERRVGWQYIPEGDQYGVLTATDANDCHRECKYDKQCKFWTFATKESYDNKGKFGIYRANSCWLLRNQGTIDKNDDMISGSKEC